MSWIEQWQNLSRRRVDRCGCEGWAERVGLVVPLDPVTAAIGALEVEEGAMQVTELSRWMASTLVEV